jgi:hypothetical protein
MVCLLCFCLHRCLAEALWWAAQKGNKAMVELLLNHGADHTVALALDEERGEGRLPVKMTPTPLECASRGGHTECCDILQVTRNGDICIKDTTPGQSLPQPPAPGPCDMCFGLRLYFFEKWRLPSRFITTSLHFVV